MERQLAMPTDRRSVIALIALLAVAGAPRGLHASVPQRPARPQAQVPAQPTTVTPGTASVAVDSVPPGAPVVLGRDTLLQVRTRLGSFSAADRAAAVQGRVLSLATTPGRFGANGVVHADSAEGGMNLVAGDLIIMTVTDADAAAVGASRDSLAAAYAATLQRALRERAEAVSVKALVLGVLYTLIATGVLILILRLFANAFPRFYRLISMWRRTRLRSVRIQKLELVSADRIADALILIARAVRIAATVLLLYFYLPLVLSFFPWTQELAAHLVGYVWTPIVGVGQAIGSYLPDLFIIAVIVVVTYYVLKLVKLFFDGIGRGSITFETFYADWAAPTYKIVRFLIIAFALILTWPYLPKSGSEGFKGVSVFLGALLTFGSASAIANVVGGVVMIYMRPFQVGDRVKIADTIGDVVEKNLLVTRVRTIKNVDVTVPNSMVLGSHIINFSSTVKEGGLILNTSVTIGYDAPWRDVHAALIDAAARTGGVLKEPHPFVLQTALSDFYVAYELNAYTDQPNRMAVTYSELHQNIQDAFVDAGIEIMSPHYEALRDGNALAMPAATLPPSYEPPSFRVSVPGLSGDGRAASARKPPGAGAGSEAEPQLELEPEPRPGR